MLFKSKQNARLAPCAISIFNLTGNLTFFILSETSRITGNALAALNLMPLADCLRETNEAFKAAFMQRNEEWAREEKPDSRAVRKAADKDVKLLMNVLVVQAAMEGESRYRELTGELGRLFAYYWNTLAVRKGRRAAEKAKKDTETLPEIAERKGHQVAAAVTDRKGRHAAAEQGAGTPPAITGMRKRRHAAVEAEGKKNTESPPANIEVPARAPIVRALTPH